MKYVLFNNQRKNYYILIYYKHRCPFDYDVMMKHKMCILIYIYISTYILLIHLNFAFKRSITFISNFNDNQRRKGYSFNHYNN